MKRARALIAGLAALVVSIVLLVLFASRPEPPYDRGFDTRVADPAYPGGGPTVLYDEGHRNTHTAKGGYKPFVQLVMADGYDVRVARDVLSAQHLEGVSVLVIVLANGSNDSNDDSAFDDVEIAVVERWVRGGGSLLLVTDHWPFGPAAAPLSARFGVSGGNGMVEDPEHHERSRGSSHLIFSADNGLLRDHAIVRGRDSAERIQHVLTFTGQSVLGPPEAVSFLALSNSATERPPGPPRVERSGGDVRVSMEYGDPAPAAGRAQGIAMEVGKGRVVVLGDASMLRAQKLRSGEKVGMNLPGYDNRQLALNIMHWLSRLL